MTDGLTLTNRLSSKVVPASGEPRLLYLLLEITGKQTGETVPSNLAFVIDTSDSMRIRLVTNEQFVELARQGQAQEIMTDGVPAYQISSISNEILERFPRRIDFVSQALMTVAEFLRPTDRFSLVAFSSRAQLIIPSASGKERLRLSQAARDLEYLRLGDETHMAEGIALALTEALREPDKRYATRLILLTDGHTRNVSECYEWARRARHAGIKLTTMGIGAEFNEDLLIPLADLTGGNAYYIETPDQLPDVFRKELGSALRIAYRAVEVKLRMTGEVKLRRVYRVLPKLGMFDQVVEMDNSYSLIVGDFDPSEPVAFLVEMIIPAWQPGSYRMVQAMLTWEDHRGESTRQNLRQDILVQVTDTATAVLDGHVMNIVERVGAFKFGEQALDAANRAAQSANPQERELATVRLRQAATRLLDMGENDLAGMMFRQADVLENRGNIEAEATKKLRYETRRIVQRS